LWVASGNLAEALSCVYKSTFMNLPDAFFFPNVRQMHHQRYLILRVDSLALWKITNEEDALLIPKNRGDKFSSGIFAIGIFWEF